MYRRTLFVRRLCSIPEVVGANPGLGFWLAKGPRVWKGGKRVAGQFWELKGLAAWCKSPNKTIPQSFLWGSYWASLVKSKVVVYFCTWVTSRFPVGQYCGMSLSCLHWCLPSLPTTNCVHSQHMIPLFPSSYSRAGSRPVLYVKFSLFIYDPWSVCIWAQCVCVHLNTFVQTCTYICVYACLSHLVYQEFSRRGNPAAENSTLWIVCHSVSLVC